MIFYFLYGRVGLSECTELGPWDDQKKKKMKLEEEKKVRDEKRNEKEKMKKIFQSSSGVYHAKELIPSTVGIGPRVYIASLIH